jgi:serine O-acetyltransferase
MSQRYHIDIPRTTKIGYGFLLLHGGPVVINSSAVIGNNVNFGHFSTVGSLLLHGAHIEDEVYIGPSVCIVEGVTIGKGSTIGAGAVVVKDVPQGSTVAGVPAKVVSHKEPGRFIWRKWNLEWNKK